MVFWGPEGKKELFRSLLSFQAITVALLNSTGNKITKRVKKMATVRAALFATTMWYVREDFLRYVHVYIFMFSRVLTSAFHRVGMFVEVGEYGLYCVSKFKYLETAAPTPRYI